MNIIGIIAEYNPFHNGHAHMIAEVRRREGDAYIVAVMSGSLTQRGETAIIDKWRRAQMAAVGGVDLIIELPTAFVLASAQNFARGGVNLLKRLNVVTKIAFGAEYAEIDVLRQAANFLDTETAQEKIRREILAGHSYAAATRRVIAENSPIGSPGSNTVLALEYLRAVTKSGANLKPLPIPRCGGAHLSEEILPQDGNIVAAAAIRRLWQRGEFAATADFIPVASCKFLPEARDFSVAERLYAAFLARLVALDPTAIASFAGVGEGLENRLLNGAKQAATWDEFIRAVSGKRYPQGRISRAVMSILLNYTRERQAEFLRAGAQYIRVLAFNRRGREILRRLKQESSLPIVTRVSSLLNRRDFAQADARLTVAQKMLKLDVQATLLQNLARSSPQLLFDDYLQSPTRQ